MEAVLASPTRGRPREFCTDAALAAALGVFWTRGYEGSSLTELTEAMGITKPSLYAAFGNKEQLFHKALDLYEREKLAYVREALAQPSARAVAEYLLRGALDAQTGAAGPRGCLGVISATSCGPEAQSIRADIVKRRASSAAALVERFKQAAREGDLPPRLTPEKLARFLYVMLQGMAVQAASGTPRAELEDAIETALSIWPEPK
jgi:AcrR family transcriptional regulator